MARDGIFSRTKGLVTTTLGETEATTRNLLGSITDGSAVLRVTLQDSLVDSQTDLLDTKVQFATKRAEAIKALQSLGYTEEAAIQALS